VPRGARGAARGASLAEVQEAMDRPWSDDELRRGGGASGGGRRGGKAQVDEVRRTQRAGNRVHGSGRGHDARRDGGRGKGRGGKSGGKGGGRGKGRR